MGQAAHDHKHLHAPSYYAKVWGVLLVLLIISILGPMLGHKALTIITAFGIAVVKALIVAAYFMHLNIEKRYIWYLLCGMLLMVGVFYFGVAADINKPEGRNWINTSAYEHMEQNKVPASDHDGGKAEHHQEH